MSENPSKEDFKKGVSEAFDRLGRTFPINGIDWLILENHAKDFEKGIVPPVERQVWLDRLNQFGVRVKPESSMSRQP